MKKLFKAVAHIFRRIFPSYNKGKTEQTGENLVIVLDDAGTKRIRQLMELTEITDSRRLFNIIFSTYDMLADHIKDGGEVILLYPDGEERSFDPTNFTMEKEE